MHFLWNDTKKRGTTFPRYDLVSKTPEPQVILDCQKEFHIIMKFLFIFHIYNKIKHYNYTHYHKCYFRNKR